MSATLSMPTVCSSRTNAPLLDAEVTLVIEPPLPLMT